VLPGVVSLEDLDSDGNELVIVNHAVLVLVSLREHSTDLRVGKTKVRVPQEGLARVSHG